jgi:hypothetical protein
MESQVSSRFRYEDWEIFVDRIFVEEELLVVLGQYLQKIRTEDALLFILAVSNFKSLFFDETKQAQSSLTIKNKFIIVNSELEINIGAGTRQKILDTFARVEQDQNQDKLLVPQDVFDEARGAVYLELTQEHIPSM